MKWNVVNEGRLESEEGFLMHVTPVNERITVYVVRSPKGPVIYAGESLLDAETICKEQIKIAEAENWSE